MNNNKTKQNQGTTLMELIIYVALVSVFLLISGYFTLDILLGKQKAYVQQEVENNITFAETKISANLRSAINIFGDSNFNTNLATTSGSKFSIQAYNSGDDPTVIDISNGILRIKKGTGQFQEITSKSVQITNLTFYNLSSTDSTTKHIRYILTIRSVNNTNNTSFDASQTIENSIELRNKNKTPIAPTYTPT